jgi:hypothetical protein
MNTTILRHDASDCPALELAAGLESPAQLAAETERPDARVFVMEDERVIAFAALWWEEAPPLEGERIGCIGGFAARDETAASRLLDEAGARLREAACTLALGPMNGNTWRRHRFVIESNGRGPFLLEPRNPAPHPEWWRAAGFEELSRYSSSLLSLDSDPVVPPPLRDRLLRSGVAIRPLDAARYDDELRAIHAISLRSFSNNFLYTPLEEEGFLDAYRKVKDRVDPDLVRLAEKDG